MFKSILASASKLAAPETAANAKPQNHAAAEQCGGGRGSTASWASSSSWPSRTSTGSLRAAAPSAAAAAPAGSSSPCRGCSRGCPLWAAPAPTSPTPAPARRSTSTDGTPTGSSRRARPRWPPRCCAAAGAWGSRSAARGPSATAGPARSRSPPAGSASPSSRSGLPSLHPLLAPLKKRLSRRRYSLLTAILLELVPLSESN